MRGILPYIGGKVRLAKQICHLFPPHTTYCEPFFGGGQVFFCKEPSEVEVVNDLSGDIVTFFRVCQNHHPELLRTLHYMVMARDWFDLLARTEPGTLTDVQRAARFFALQKMSYAARVIRQNYGIHITQKPAFDSRNFPAGIEAVHDRLANVQIENLPYEQVLKRYDRPTTLFYLDPPYFRKKLYKFNFNDDQFSAMADLLKKLKGKFILSLNDTVEIRQLFSSFRQERVHLHYPAQRASGKRFSELLIRNF